jgi:hypothetical protein
LKVVLPAGNLFDQPAGATGLSVAHGWVTLLHPLTPGTHTITIDNASQKITTTILSGRVISSEHVPQSSSGGVAWPCRLIARVGCQRVTDRVTTSAQPGDSTPSRLFGQRLSARRKSRISQ